MANPKCRRPDPEIARLVEEAFERQNAMTPEERAAEQAGIDQGVARHMAEVERRQRHATVVTAGDRYW
jgi:hypothetical protein